jgi:hypothetical protein
MRCMRGEEIHSSLSWIVVLFGDEDAETKLLAAHCLGSCPHEPIVSGGS